MFAKYSYNEVFIETGCYLGDGIQNALVTGYKRVYSIELGAAYYAGCAERFRNDPRVTVLLGDSAIVLRDLLGEIDRPATFWLDGHFSGSDTARGQANTPLLAELAAIGAHRIKNHTILVDDIRILNTWWMDYIDVPTVKAKALEINADYGIYFEDGHTPLDVMVFRLDTSPSNVRNNRIDIHLQSKEALRFFFSAMDLADSVYLRERCRLFCVEHRLMELDCPDILSRRAYEITGAGGGLREKSTAGDEL